MFNIIRRINPISAKSLKCEVLIYDSIGQNWLHHAIPDFATTAYLNTRSSFPVIFTFKFWMRFVGQLCRNSSRHGTGLFLVYLSALLDTIEPKVIVSGSDNNHALSKYAESRSDLIVILVQTALRDTIQSWLPNGTLPIYFAYGDIELRLFDLLNISCQDIIPIGSMKMGIAIGLWDPTNSEQIDLCFISDYRPARETEHQSELERAIARLNKILFMYTCRYARENHLSLRVLSKTREPEWQSL